jgi:hypothetical protein
MKKRNLVRALTGATLIVLGGAIFVNPANAVYTCGKGQICMFKDNDFRNTVAVEPAFQHSGGELDNFAHNHFTNGTVVDGQVSSVINNSDFCLALFDGTNLTGANEVVPPHTSGNLYGFNDKASSGVTYPGSETCR